MNRKAGGVTIKDRHVDAMHANQRLVASFETRPG
jgi:hypothetical protein